VTTFLERGRAVAQKGYRTAQLGRRLITSDG
jgi:hypothetical protein